MTPLAKEVAEHMRDKEFRRQYQAALVPFPDVKCFDVTQARGVIEDLGEQARRRGVVESLSFLPAPATWIEWRVEGAVLGWMLVEKDKRTATLTQLTGITVPIGNGEDGFGLVAVPLADIPLLDAADPDNWAVDTSIKLTSGAPGLAAGAGRVEVRDEMMFLENMHGQAFEIYATLAIINSPKIIGARVHKPSSGLQKRLGRSLGKATPHELLPWHEILLEVNPPSPGQGDGTERLTGPRALHFVRQFLRIRLGRLEHVRAHWRGDPTLGVHQSTYAVVPGKASPATRH